jgi:hypothetical protein
LFLGLDVVFCLVDWLVVAGYLLIGNNDIIVIRLIGLLLFSELFLTESMRLRKPILHTLHKPAIKRYLIIVKIHKAEMQPLLINHPIHRHIVLHNVTPLHTRHIHLVKRSRPLLHHPEHLPKHIIPYLNVILIEDSFEGFVEEFIFVAVLPEEVDEVDGAGLVGVEGVLELDGRVGEVEDGGGVVDGGDLAAFVLPVGF